MNRTTQLLNLYGRMLDALGPSHWWPGESPFEVAVGAILTQNTNWRNVEKAIANLRVASVLTPQALAKQAPAVLAELIRPSGFFRLKAERLAAFLEFLQRHAPSPGDLASPRLAFLDGYATPELRRRLLAIKGIGPETADSILLYALERPVFVVDAYTRRILSRHLMVPETATYEEIQDLFTTALEPDTVLYNEYHALIVRTAKNWCGKQKARCESCPLGDLLE